MTAVEKRTDAEVLREFCERVNKRVTHASGYFVCHLCGHTAGGEAKWVAQVAEAHSCDALKAVRALEETIGALVNSADYEEACGCNHDDEHCCAKVGEPCSRCDSESALSRAAAKVENK